MDTLQSIIGSSSNTNVFLVSFLGMLLHILLNLSTAKGIMSEFSVIKWIQENGINLLMSLIGLASLYFIQEEMFFPNRMQAFMTGFTIDAVLKNFIKTYNVRRGK